MTTSRYPPATDRGPDERIADARPGVGSAIHAHAHGSAEALTEHPCPHRPAQRNSPARFFTDVPAVRYRTRDTVRAAPTGRIRRNQSVAIMGVQFSHLFIRCYHGRNTWDERHFIERLWYDSRQTEYVRARYLKRDLWSHAAFQLTEQEQSRYGVLCAESSAAARWAIAQRPSEHLAPSLVQTQ